MSEPTGDRRVPDAVREGARKQKLSLLFDYDQVIAAIREIEKQMEPRDKELDRWMNGGGFRNDIHATVERLKQEHGDNPRREDVPESSTFSVGIGGFEGYHGFNRYSVRKDGTVWLSRRHSTQPCADKAEELGIGVLEW